MRNASLLSSALFRRSVLLAAVTPLLANSAASAQTVLFEDNFDDGAGATRWSFTGRDAANQDDWKVNFDWDFTQTLVRNGASGSPAAGPNAYTTVAGYQYFDYRGNPSGTLRDIPQSPGTVDGAPKRALRISVNDGGTAANAVVNAYPRSAANATTPLVITGDYRLEGVLWHNFNGSGFTLNGVGSTQFSVVGGTDDTTRALNPDSTTLPARGNGTFYAMASEGGAASSYQGFTVGQPSDDGTLATWPNRSTSYPGATRANRFDRTTGNLVQTTTGTTTPGNAYDAPDNPENPYWDEAGNGPFPGYEATNNPDGFESYGAPGKKWVPFVLERKGLVQTYSVNGKIINTTVLDSANATTPFVGLADTFNSIAAPAELISDDFALFDNIKVTQLVATPTYSGTAGGDWNTPGNWAGGVVPNAAGQAAILPGDAAASSVALSAPVTVATLDIRGAGGTTVTGSRITVGTGGTATLVARGGAHVVSAPVTLDSNAVSIFVMPSASLTLGDVQAPNANIVKHQRGQLNLNVLRAKSLNIIEGTVRITGAGPQAAGRIVNLDVFLPTADATWSGKLDIGKSLLAIDFGARSGTGTNTATPPVTVTFTESPIGRLQAYLTPSGTNQKRIFSSDLDAQLAADPTAPFALRAILSTALGVTGPTTWLGQQIDTTTYIVGYANKADANLDAQVNFDDLLILAANYNTSGLTGTTGIFATSWTKGDATGDGSVNFDDLLVLAANYNTSVTGSLGGDWALAQSAVPEPTSLAVVGVGAAALLGRRRRR